MTPRGIDVEGALHQAAVVEAEAGIAAAGEPPGAAPAEANDHRRQRQ